ncbi:recombinase zinc beta ribbon domain-containing protein [Candidatus Collierbacteria bacterium]|nr:recombinase zinc beta ribbon domain-containing protein [Candidatus Collierbacteria bacterium]
MLTREEFELIQQILCGKSKPKSKKHEFALNGFLTCGECRMRFTGENHVKKYHNGSEGVFRYYRCTKKARKQKCLQKYIREKDLKDQVTEKLLTIELDQDWINLGVKWATEMEREEQGQQKTVTQAVKNAYFASVKRINNLSDTVANTDDSEVRNELNGKLQTELILKKKLKKQVDGLESQKDDSFELTNRTIKFASTARERFENGSLEDKRTIIRAIGSNLTIKDQKLLLHPRKPFLMVQERFQQARIISNSLELNKKTVFIAQNAEKDFKVSVMRGRRDSNPRFPP